MKFWQGLARCPLWLCKHFTVAVKLLDGIISNMAWPTDGFLLDFEPGVDAWLDFEYHIQHPYPILVNTTCLLSDVVEWCDCKCDFPWAWVSLSLLLQRWHTEGRSSCCLVRVVSQDGTFGDAQELGDIRTLSCVLCGTSYSFSRRDTMMWSCSTSAVPHCQHQPAGKAWWCWCVHCRRHLLALRGLQSWVSTKVWISSVLFHLLSLTFPNFDNIIVFCPSGTSFSSENSSKLCSLNDSPGVNCFHYSLVGRLGNHARNTCGTHRWCWWVCCSCLPCIDCWGMLYSPSLAACRVRWDWLGNLGKHCSCQCNHSRVTLEWLLFILSLFKGSEEMVLGCIQLWRKVSIAGGSKGGMVQCVKLTM